MVHQQVSIDAKACKPMRTLPAAWSPLRVPPLCSGPSLRSCSGLQSHLKSIRCPRWICTLIPANPPLRRLCSQDPHQDLADLDQPLTLGAACAGASAAARTTRTVLQQHEGNQLVETRVKGSEAAMGGDLWHLLDRAAVKGAPTRLRRTAILTKVCNSGRPDHHLHLDFQL